MGKILDALKGKNRPTGSTTPASSTTEDGAIDFTKFLFVAQAFAVALFIAVVLFASYSVAELFGTRLNTTVFEAGLAVIASVGVCVTTLFVVLTTRHAPVRGLGSIILIAWTLIVLVLVGLNSALRGGLLAVPDGITNVGQVAAALLAALALIPVLTIPLAMNDRSRYGSAASAAGKYIGFVAKGAGIGASAIASAYFGVSRGINPLLAVFCGVVLESCFLWAYLKLNDSREKKDVFDVWMWAVSVILFGLFISAVSVETLATLGGIDVPIVSMFGEVGASLYVSAVGLSVLLTITVHVLTSLIDMKDENGDGQIDPHEIRVGTKPVMALEGTDVPQLESAAAEEVPARKIGETKSGQGSPDDPKSS
jgi:hypothetical protein